MPPSFRRMTSWSNEEKFSYGSITLDSGLRSQAQLAILAFKARVAVSADLHLHGFDTHRQARSGSQLAVGEPDRFRRLPVGVRGDPWGGRPPSGSDGGPILAAPTTTTWTQGKDHWPIGSFVVMGEEADLGPTVW